MKTITRILIILFTCIFLVGCKAEENEKIEEMQTLDIEPQVEQMRSICELATLDCYYHNVAKYNFENAEGVLWWQKDRTFWIEYGGTVRIGIDASRVTLTVSGDDVTIEIPPAKVLGCKVDEITKDSFIVAKGSAKIEAEHEKEAIKDAQMKMELSAKSDTVLLTSAQQRAQTLLEDYVKNVGASIGKKYKIKWVYLD